MNPRIIKEVRLLFWPWCLIVVAALLPLLSAAIHHFRELSSFFCALALFGGIPFLAALSFGGEFQQRTISMLLGQPVGRMRIWKEKQLVLVTGVLAALPFFWFGWYDRSELETVALAIFGAWLLATVSSATYWTLFTRSTLGGLVIGQVSLFLVGITTGNLGLRIFGPEPSVRALHVAEGLGAVICLGYSGLMLWLGRRKLAQFQATGGIAGNDLMVVGPRLMPAALVELLRCRPAGPTLNLIRKEFRLLQPLWTITMLFMACWVCIVITFRVIPQTEEWKTWREVVPMLAVCLYMPLCVMLAGCLSLGEERLSGTHAWHLTLPVSARRQWFIKLVMALGAGVFCAMVIPFLTVSVGQLLLGSPFGTDFEWGLPSARNGAPLLLAIFPSFPAFWCACAVNGTVRAALWTLPVMCALCFVGAGGIWVAQAGQLGETVAPLMTVIVSKFQLSPLALTWSIYSWREIGLILPTLLVAVIQSYRLFRTQPDDRIIPVIRRLLPLAFVAFLGALTCGTIISSVGRQHHSILINETRTAIRKLHIDDKNVNQMHPLKLTVEDLAKASPMSDLTRQWLRSASVTVYPASSKSGKVRANVVTIHFADGSEYHLN